MSDNIDDIIKNLPADALTPEAAKVLGRTESAQEAPVQSQEAPTVGGRKTFKRKDGRKHRRKSHKKNKRRSSKRKQ